TSATAASEASTRTWSCAEVSSSNPPAKGLRVDWENLPAEVRAALEDRLGSPVVASITQPTGFSPGLAARLRLGDDRRVFIKAVSEAANPDSPSLHRREARIVAALPVSAPVPRLLWTYDEGGWVALCFGRGGAPSIRAVDGAGPGARG